MKLSLMTFAFAPTLFLAISSIASAQSPAEREAQRLVPRTPGNWPAAYTADATSKGIKRPLTAIRNPAANALQSGYCENNGIRSKVDGSYVQYASIHETCVEPGVHDNPPLGFAELNLQDLCRNAAYLHNPQVTPGFVLGQFVLACTLDKFTETEIQISIRQNYIFNNPDGPCFNDENAVCGNTIRSTTVINCPLVAQEPMPEWQCYLGGTYSLYAADRRTSSTILFDTPVPTDPGSREVLRAYIEKLVRERL
jgi:hypothetical protein